MDTGSQYYHYSDNFVMLTHCCITLLCEVARQQQNAEQLDAANNNARPKASQKRSDTENNNVGSKSSPRGHSVSSSVSRDVTTAAQNCADDGIQIMPYTDFVRSRMAHGLAPPRGVVVRRNGRHVLVPQYVVQHHRQHRAHVRSLRRHGYESEDGRIAGHPNPSRGYDSDQHCGNTSRHHHRRAAAGHGYESDIGYRSDVAAYNSRHGPQLTAAAYPNPSVYSSDFTSGDWNFGTERDVYRQKVPPPSFMAQSGHNIPPHEHSVRETIAEEVMDFEGQPDEQLRLLRGQDWPSSVPLYSQFAHQYGISHNAAYPYEARRRRNKSSHRRNVEPIEL